MTANLSALLDDVEDAEMIGFAAHDVEVTSVTQDTATVVAGSLYCCIAGNVVDGHDLAGRAVDAGARSLLVERVLDVAVPQVRVPSTRRAVAPVAAAFWDHPSSRLAVVGVTGTNGKTTTTILLATAMRLAGRPCGVIGTLSGPRTTPAAPDVQAKLAAFVDDGCDAVAMEVSSIALDQHRVDAIDFAVGVWTNLSQDHLDYHADMEAYYRAKASLFANGRCRTAVINHDDEAGRRLLADLAGSATPAVAYGIDDATDLEVGVAASRFRWRGHAVQLPLGGVHNVANAIAAATAAEVLGVAPYVVAEGLSQAPVVTGRWEAVDAGQNFAVVVDYAHTPDGLVKVLTAAKAAVAAGSRVLVVFGCGGDRDRSKRPLMAKAATELADIAILTSDNPRSEDPLTIIAEAAAGDAGRGNLLIEPDRERAIGLALAQADVGDLVILAGKGHETGQIIGDRVIPFDDREVARRLLATILRDRTD